MIRLFRLDKFVALCRPVENNHLMTTSILADVDCVRWMEITDDIARQAAGRPTKGETTDHGKDATGSLRGHGGVA